MAGGLRYETGRDMPPGMAERVAVQIARRLEAAALENLPTAENKASATGGECGERREGG